MIRAKPVNQAEERGIGAKIIFWLYSCRWFKFQGALSQTVIPINVQRLPPKKLNNVYVRQLSFEILHIYGIFFYICATPQTITVVGHRHGIILKEKRHSYSVILEKSNNIRIRSSKHYIFGPFLVIFSKRSHKKIKNQPFWNKDTKTMTKNIE